MTKRINTSHHMIDLLFPITVFFVFAVSTLVVLILSANIYKETTALATDNYTSRTCYSYVLEKVRQNDENGNLHIMKQDDVTYLALTHINDKTGKEDYTTYIYSYKGNLKELRVLPKTKISPEAGTDIVALRTFTPKKESPGLYRFTFTEKNGNEYSVSVAERSSR